MPYSPLSRVFLTGSFSDAGRELSGGDFRQLMPRFGGDNAKANAGLLAPLHTSAAERGATVAQIALAWVQQQAQSHGLTVVALLEPIAGRVAGERYADMSLASATRET